MTALSIIIIAEIIITAMLPIMLTKAESATKMDTAITVSIVSRRALLVLWAAFAPLEREEDAQADSLHSVHEPVMLKRL